MAPNADGSFTELSPFYTPGAPPPTLPIPIAQTEVGKLHSPSKLLAQEEIGPKSKSHRNPVTRFHPYPKPTSSKSTRFARQRSQTPKTSSTRATTPRAVSPSSDEGSVSHPTAEEGEGSLQGGSSEEDEEDDEDEDEDGDLIPKPDGEAGRPGRGGYNLEETLGWEKKDFQRVKKYVTELIDKDLNTSKSLASQSMASVVAVRNQVTERFPVLRNYAQSWPATDLIRLRLKYTSGRARHTVNKADAKVGKLLRSSSRK
ncbi:hypothetical protein GALMADRAFT_137714 [Galerina marginata CBS 339.88]|uniref:Uncharacterized protein n=1 Tax=Galerina marginata (strain CBS 339.88) TaxID=685588 RepID=A0A067T6C7_GALM3|nr:hypothetical protein GALMADRAFT_137714 [Galerina marginata CBS 339.88]